MDKNGKLGMRCTYCERPAVPDTDPPVCSEHADMDKTASDKSSLKGVSQDGSIWV